MRSLIQLLVMLTLAGSFMVKKCAPVIVCDATKQLWVSGAPGGRTGISYRIKLHINTTEKTEFSNLWIGTENVPLSVELFKPGTAESLAKGDSVLLTYNRVNNEPAADFVAKRVPVEYKGEALIECLIAGKARYYTVKKFREINSLNSE